MSMQTPAQIRASKAAEIRTRLEGIKTRAATTAERLTAARNTPRFNPATTPVAEYVAEDGTVFTDQAAFTNYVRLLQDQKATQQRTTEEKRSAFQLLKQEFTRYGLGDLVGDVEALVRRGLPPAEFAIELRQTPTYQKRFKANQDRINAGLRALSEAEYINLEDQYQNMMRQYGLPPSYYEKDQFGTQANLQQFIAADVSPAELEDRLQIAFDRVQNAPPEVIESLRAFYPDITNGDVLAYTLNPKQAIQDIRRKVTAAEIGAGAVQAGLGLRRERAEELGRFGITGQQAQAGFQQIAGGVERGGQLAAIYDQTPYGQETAEQEIFGLTGAPQARRQRQKLTQQEQAAFGGQTGLTGGALSRERAGQF